MKTNMREILFRAKSIKTKKWLYGFYYQMTFGPNDELRHFLVLTPLGTGEDRIDPKTLGQFTGLFDKNGVKIFEGDIVSNESDPVDCKVGLVVFHRGSFLWSQAHGDNNNDPHGFNLSSLCDLKENFDGVDVDESCIVLGNIHDNPELLKGGEV